MVVLATGRKPVRVRGVVLVLLGWWARLFERSGLEIAGRDGFAVVPANLEGAEAHVG